MFGCFSHIRGVLDLAPARTADIMAEQPTWANAANRI
jgi:hypothetical protein